jgi:hypothetical protein
VVARLWFSPVSRTPLRPTEANRGHGLQTFATKREPEMRMGSPPSCRPYAVGDEEEGSELLAAGSPPPHLSVGSGDEVEVRYVRRSDRSPPQSPEHLLASTASPRRSLLLPATFGVPERPGGAANPLVVFLPMAGAAPATVNCH